MSHSKQYLGVACSALHVSTDCWLYGWLPSMSGLQACTCVRGALQVYICYHHACVDCAPPAGSPSRGGDVMVDVFDINQLACALLFILFLYAFLSLWPWHKPAELVHSFSFCSCVYFCPYGPFSCISFHEFSRQLSAVSFCSFGLLSTLLVRATVYLLMRVSFNPDVILCVDWA